MRKSMRWSEPIISLVLSAFVAVTATIGSILFVLGLASLFIAVDAFVLISLWPIVIPKLLPGLVASGYIAGEVSFHTMFWTLAAIMIMRPLNITKLFTKSSKKEQSDDNGKPSIKS